MQITFYTAENMGLFWEYVKVLLTGIAPGIMISFAVVAVGLVLGIVVKSWKQAATEQEDDDDDIEVRHY